MHSTFLPQSWERRRLGGESDKIISQPSIPRVGSVPFDQWPIWARAAAKFRRASDLGLGDTIVHLIGDTRSEQFKKWFTRKFSKSCGCTERQKWLNLRYPYNANSNPLH